MNERDWIILKTLYEIKNITKTAETLYMSQSTLSYRIQQIEKDFGTPIIVRGTSGIEFNTQGEYLANYAKKMIIELEKTKEVIKNLNNKVEGKLRLNVVSSFARFRLLDLIEDFMNLYQDAQINIRTGKSTEVLKTVSSEEVHIGIIRGEHTWMYESFLISEEPIYLVYKEPIELNDLTKLPRITYNITDIKLKNSIEKWWLDNFSQPPKSFIEVDTVDTSIDLVKSGLGYLIIPGICLDSRDLLFKKPITSQDRQQLVRRTYLIYKASNLELSVVRAFVDFVKNRKITN